MVLLTHTSIGIMSKKSVEEKPSKTAMFAALHRAIANKEFKNERFGADYLAEYFLPYLWKILIEFKIFRAIFKSRINKYSPGLHEYVMARTAFFDSIFRDALNKNIPQILSIGAGYDTRAYRFAKLNKATNIFELDIATTQNRKKKCLKKARIDIPQSVVFVPINLTKETLIKILEKAGYEARKRTLFVLEGVSYYLEPESVDATLSLVSHSLHSESLIAFDYAMSISEDNLNNYYGANSFTQLMNKYHSDERFLFNIYEDKIESFLEQRGLKIIKHLDNREIEKTFLLDKNGALIGKVTGHFRFVLASPNKR